VLSKLKGNKMSNPILQNANPSSSNGQTVMPTIAPTESHTFDPGTAPLGFAVGTAHQGIIGNVGDAGWPVMTATGSSGSKAEGGNRQPLDITLPAAGGIVIVNPA
jgi:hypothetical protein